MAQLELITRFGSGSTAPLDTDLAAAVHEVFVEEHPSLSESDYREHPNAWLSYGQPAEDKWTVYTVQVSRDGRVLFYKLADQDDADPEFEKSMVVGEVQALALFRLLAAGNVTALLAQSWQEGRSDA